MVVMLSMCLLVSGGFVLCLLVVFGFVVLLVIGLLAGLVYCLSSFVVAGISLLVLV